MKKLLFILGLGLLLTGCTPTSPTDNKEFFGDKIGQIDRVEMENELITEIESVVDPSFKLVDFHFIEPQNNSKSYFTISFEGLYEKVLPESIDKNTINIIGFLIDEKIELDELVIRYYQKANDTNPREDIVYMRLYTEAIENIMKYIKKSDDIGYEFVGNLKLHEMSLGNFFPFYEYHIENQDYYGNINWDKGSLVNYYFNSQSAERKLHLDRMCIEVKTYVNSTDEIYDVSKTAIKNLVENNIETYNEDIELLKIDFSIYSIKDGESSIKEHTRLFDFEDMKNIDWDLVNNYDELWELSNSSS